MYNTESVLVFKTNIQNDYERIYVQALLNSAAGIHDCTVDIEDVDKVLRIEVDSNTNEIDMEQYVIEKVNSYGFMCKPLEDEVQKVNTPNMYYANNTMYAN